MEPLVEPLVNESCRTAEAGPQLPWYEWYPSDFSGNYIVQAMTVAQELGYRRLLDAAWTSRTPCFLPNDPQFLAAVARMNDLQWGTDGRIVLQMFVLTENGQYVYHPKQLEIYRRSLKVWMARHKGAQTRAQQLKKDTSAVTSRERVVPPVVEPVVHVTTTTTTIERDTPPDDLDELTEEIGHLHPANAHLKGKFLPENQKYEIAEAIQRDCPDLVRAGTLNYRDAVAQWPKSEHRFITNPVKFYRESEYLKDPATWERTDGQQKPGPQTVNLARAGAGIVRAINNVSAAQTAIQVLRDRRARGGSDGGDPTGQPD